MANVKTTAVRTRPANDPSPITLLNKPSPIDLGVDRFRDFTCDDPTKPGVFNLDCSGTPSGPPSVFKNQYSVSFDGADDFLHSDPNITHASVSSYTMSAWVNIGAFKNGAGVYQMRGGHSAIDWTYNNFLRVDSATSVSFHHRGAGGYQACTYTGVNLSLNTWYNFAQVWDGTNVKLYLDGVLISTTTTTNTASFAGRSGYNIKFDLGRGRGGSSYPCKIDEFAWWDSDKSSSISNIYNSGAPSDISSLSPVTWYRMGDNDGGTGTTITDQGSGGNDATLFNGPTFSTNVPTAFPNQYSVDLDGANEYVSVTPSSSINLYGLSVWFKCDFVVDKNAVRGALLAPGGTNWFIGLGGNFTGTLTDELISINTGARYGYCSSTDTISAGWHNVVVAWSTTSATTGGNGYDIYLDGVKVGNQSNTTYGAATLFSLPTTEIRLGERFGAYPFPGLIDEVAIFNSTLSSSDISSIYNSGVPNDISSLSPVAWWRMGDNNSGTGTTITDQGSGGNDGTLINGPTFSTNVP